MADIDVSMLGALLPASREFIVTPPPALTELDPDEPPGFNARQVIYRKVVPSGMSGYRYAFIDKPTPIDDAFNFKYFVWLAASGNYARNDFMVPEADPMGILVKKDSYVFIHLDDRMPTFEHRTPGVALGDIAKPEERLYGDLHYVTREGEYEDLAFPGSRLVFFKARFWTNPNDTPQHIQKFFLRLSNGVWIDPDIRHPGLGSD